MRRAILALVLVGCGGAPFSVLPDESIPDAGNLGSQLQTTTTDAKAPENVASEASVSEGGPDVRANDTGLETDGAHEASPSPIATCSVSACVTADRCPTGFASCCTGTPINFDPAVTDGACGCSSNGSCISASDAGTTPEAASPPDAEPCTGCIDNAGICQPETDTSCGTGGGACTDCTQGGTQASQCNSGVCRTACVASSCPACPYAAYVASPCCKSTGSCGCSTLVGGCQ